MDCHVHRPCRSIPLIPGAYPMDVRSSNGHNSWPKIWCAERCNIELVVGWCWMLVVWLNYIELVGPFPDFSGFFWMFGSSWFCSMISMFVLLLWPPHHFTPFAEVMWKQIWGDEFPMWPHYVIIESLLSLARDFCPMFAAFRNSLLVSFPSFSPWSFPKSVLCYLCYPYSTHNPVRWTGFSKLQSISWTQYDSMIPYDSIWCSAYLSIAPKSFLAGKNIRHIVFFEWLWQLALGIFEQQKTITEVTRSHHDQIDQQTLAKRDRYHVESPGHTMIFNKPLLIVFGGNNGQQVNVGCILYKHVEAVKDTSFIPLQVSKCRGFYICFYLSFLSVPFGSLFHGHAFCHFHGRGGVWHLDPWRRAISFCMARGGAENRGAENGF